MRICRATRLSILLVILAAVLVYGGIGMIGRAAIVYEKRMEGGERLVIRQTQSPSSSYWKERVREMLGDKAIDTKRHDPYVYHFVLNLIDPAAKSERAVWSFTADDPIAFTNYFKVLDVALSRCTVAILFHGPRGVGCAVIDRRSGQTLFQEQRSFITIPDGHLEGSFEDNSLVAWCDDHDMLKYQIPIRPGNKDLQDNSLSPQSTQSSSVAP